METQQQQPTATPPWAQPVPGDSKAQAAVDRPEQVVGTSGNTLTVGCKLPNGLHMDISRHGQPLQRVTLRGSNSSKVIGGFGITENVDSEFFNEWMRLNAALPAVRNGLIFAHSKTSAVREEAKSRASLTNGLERIDPKKPGKGLMPVPGSGEPDPADNETD